MGYLLDTCVLSEFTKPRPSPVVDRWLVSVPDALQFSSVLVVGELEKGISKLASGRRRAALERWLSEVRARLGDRTLPVDEAVAMEWGRLTARAEAHGQPLPVVDALIAATALVHGHTVATRNTSDIARCGAATFDPWRA